MRGLSWRRGRAGRAPPPGPARQTPPVGEEHHLEVHPAIDLDPTGAAEGARHDASHLARLRRQEAPAAAEAGQRDQAHGLGARREVDLSLDEPPAKGCREPLLALGPERELAAQDARVAAKLEDLALDRAIGAPDDHAQAVSAQGQGADLTVGAADRVAGVPDPGDPGGVDRGLFGHRAQGRRSASRGTFANQKSTASWNSGRLFWVCVGQKWGWAPPSSGQILASRALRGALEPRSGRPSAPTRALPWAWTRLSLDQGQVPRRER